MAGEAIQLMRVLRVKPTLDECFGAKVYLELGASFKPLKDFKLVMKQFGVIITKCNLKMKVAITSSVVLQLARSYV